MTKPFTPATGNPSIDKQFADLWTAIQQIKDRDVLAACIDTAVTLSAYCEDDLADMDQETTDAELASNARAIGDRVRNGDAAQGWRRSQ